MRLSPKRRHFLKTATVSAGLAAAPAFAVSDDADWHALAADVRAEMAWAWRHYKDRA